MKYNPMTNQNQIGSMASPCHHCEGKGYISIRDCSGEIQREENCSFCDGIGHIFLKVLQSNTFKKFNI